MTTRLRPVVLTRPLERQVSLAQQLHQAGCPVVELPALTLEARPAPDDAVRATLYAPCPFDAVVWVSRAAWQCDWDRAVYQASARGDARALPGVLAAVGLATAQAIAHDLRLPLQTMTYPKPPALADSEGLWQQLQPKLAPGARVLVVRGQTGRPWLIQAMTEAGLAVTTRAVYVRGAAVWSDEAVAHLRATDQPVWLVTSAESLAAIKAQFERHGLQGQPGAAPGAVVVVHPRLSEPVQGWLAAWPHRAVPVHVTSANDAALFETLLQAAQA